MYGKPQQRLMLTNSLGTRDQSTLRLAAHCGTSRRIAFAEKSWRKGPYESSRRGQVPLKLHDTSNTWKSTMDKEPVRKKTFDLHIPDLFGSRIKHLQFNILDNRRLATGCLSRLDPSLFAADTRHPSIIAENTSIGAPDLQAEQWPRTLLDQSLLCLSKVA